jgi:biotin carboxyl carrier protein
VKLQVRAAGRTRLVDVTQRGDIYLVVVDGHENEVSVSDIDGALSLLVGERSYEVRVAPGIVSVDGTAVEVDIIRPSWSRRGGAAAHEQTGPQRIVAPMPGKIVKVLVGKGDRVEARQGVVVVEAMKMENELRTRAAGTVTEVRAEEGALVEAGAILIVVE